MQPAVVMVIRRSGGDQSEQPGLLTGPATDRQLGIADFQFSIAERLFT
jgi:hypothetical protein